MSLASITLDCANPQRLAGFWSEALGYRLSTFSEPFAVLVPPEGEGGPIFVLQRVPEPKLGKNRMHVDLQVEDLELESKRLEALGASRLIDEPRRLGQVRLIVMADPEGNEFCIRVDSSSG